ncbi:MAG TPA: hypothetical protein VGU73_09860 [Acidimicrobiia bacterium]|nr:hypothetical protein [Acidimicrobiia bacterium]
MVASIQDELWPRETVLAVLPFAATPRRPKGPEGKVREGVYQTGRRYRPLVATTERLLVVHAYKTPFPKGLLAAFPVAGVEVLGVEPGRMGQQRLSLSLPGEGTVPFVLGRFDLDELPAFEEALARA